MTADSGNDTRWFAGTSRTIGAAVGASPPVIRVADVPVFLLSPVQHRVCVLDGKHTENLSNLLLIK